MFLIDLLSQIRLYLQLFEALVAFLVDRVSRIVISEGLRWLVDLSISFSVLFQLLYSLTVLYDGQRDDHFGIVKGQCCKNGVFSQCCCSHSWKRDLLLLLDYRC